MSAVKGKSIKIFLVDGGSDGLKTAELDNWTGKAVVVPRNKLGQLQEREECNKPSVYFLFGQEEDEYVSLPMVYIGETESLIDRLFQHKRKEFWHTAIAFTSKDENLTKAHVRYLESRCLAVAEEIGRCELQNSQGSDLPSLPEADIAEIERFLENLVILLSALSYPILKKFLSKEQASSDSDPIFICKGKGAEARGRMLEGNAFVIYKDSTAVAELGGSLRSSDEKLVKKLCADGSLKKQSDELYVFTKDYVCTSPSHAGRLVLGRTAASPKEWKAEDGQSLQEKTLSKGQASTSSDPIFICSGKGAKGEGRPSGKKGFVIYKDSTATTKLVDSLSEHDKNLVNELCKNGCLKKQDENLYIFTEDYLCSGPSRAARLILGSAQNGWEVWKTEHGQSLGDWSGRSPR